MTRYMANSYAEYVVKHGNTQNRDIKMVQVLNIGGTVTFRCPVCRQLHNKAQFGGDEYICTNSVKRRKKTQNARPVDIISRNAYNFNRFSTKEDRYDDIELTNVNRAIKGAMDRDFGGGKKSNNY